MTAQDKYKQLSKDFIDLTGLKVGSKVRVTHKVEPYAFGWSSNWNDNMDSAVGKEFTIERFDDGDMDFRLRNENELANGYYFPFFVLEILKDDDIVIPLESGDYEVIVKHNGDIEVGCQKISHEKLKEIYEASLSKMN